MQAAVAQHHAGGDACVGVHRAGLPQRAHCTGQHATVKPQLAVGGERVAQRAGHAANAKLQGVAITHELRDMGTDLRFHVAARRISEGQHRRVGLHRNFDFRHVHPPTAPCTRQARVEMGHAALGAWPHEGHEVGRQARAAITIGIGQGELGDGNIKR